MDPTTAGGALAAKFGVAFAGFVGAILSLSFLKGLSRWQAFCAVLTGFSCSVFLTPFLVAFFSLPTDVESRYGVAFLVGLLAMNLIPGVKAALERLLATRSA
ncbi:peptidase M48, Ste24p [Pseudomonas xionganensis]|uniref:Peptidase M48, Ste24p n=1 Tax=Pseudomonas xionganensis TaxID=2654845 RepID=A0A6I4KUL0_9PSED|nr:peptidase M48, Ste24p [Pseudomonas xionganensis]MVW75381.1 peptidase M48, Ste24p [Pseudomonas xionganensis]